MAEGGCSVAVGAPTVRQQQVLELVAKGYSNKQISTRIGISEAGVKKHLEALRRRYQVGNRTALVTAALQADDLRLGPKPDAEGRPDAADAADAADAQALARP